MITITKQDFLDHLEGGIALSHSKTTHLDLAQFDSDRNGVLQGAELRPLFHGVDHFDRDGSPHSIKLSGRVGEIFRGLCRGRVDLLNRGPAISDAAQMRLKTMTRDYGLDGTPTSPHPRLSHNRHPGITRLSWLRGQWKCTQFVGDVLTQAGVSMPVHRMKDGSVHYMQAEALPHQRRFFHRVASLEQLKAGDIVVVDWAERGTGTAHTEVFSEVQMRRGGIRSIGAHATGVTEEQGWRPIGDWHDTLRQATFEEHTSSWTVNQYTIYLLRPTRAVR